jgi:hypothetical protein
VLTEDKLRKLQSATTERPDLSAGLGRNVPEDTQERFWKDAGAHVAGAKQALKSDTEWRKKYDVDNILSVRCASLCCFWVELDFAGVRTVYSLLLRKHFGVQQSLSRTRIGARSLRSAAF